MAVDLINFFVSVSQINSGIDFFGLRHHKLHGPLKWSQGLSSYSLIEALFLSYNLNGYFNWICEPIPYIFLCDLKFSSRIFVYSKPCNSPSGFLRLNLTSHNFPSSNPHLFSTSKNPVLPLRGDIFTELAIPLCRFLYPFHSPKHEIVYVLLMEKDGYIRRKWITFI